MGTKFCKSGSSEKLSDPVPKSPDQNQVSEDKKVTDIEVKPSSNEGAHSRSDSRSKDAGCDDNDTELKIGHDGMVDESVSTKTGHGGMVDESVSTKTGHGGMADESVSTKTGHGGMADESVSTKTGHGGMADESVSTKTGLGSITSGSLVEEGNKTVDEIVAESWKVIEEQMKDRAKVNKDKVTNNEPGWRVVRLFVSSTFNDYFSEREVLVKKVFPELRDWCLQRRLHLVECDLRWGVPKDTPTAVTIYTCFEEISRCHGNTDAQGLFLNMLSQRYGWIPDKADIPEELAQQYQWVYNISITHMEILLGGLRKQNDNALFLFRKEGEWLERLSDAGRRQFCDQSELGPAQMKELKKRLKEIYPNQVFEYSCEFDEVNTDRIRLTGLDGFAAETLRFFKAAIERSYPDTGEAPDETPEMQEQKNHDLLLEQKGGLVRGREKEVKLLLAHCQEPMQMENLTKQWSAIAEEFEEAESKEAEGNAQDEENAAQDNLKGGNYPLIAIVAEPGVGKSSLMAKCIQEACKTSMNVFYHFIGCSASSTSHTNLMTRLCLALAGSDNSKRTEIEEAGKSEFNLKKVYEDLLKDRVEADDAGRTTFFIDDLSQLSVDEGHLEWIPKEGISSKGVTFILSMVKGDRAVDDLKRYAPGAVLWLELGQLMHLARTDIIENYFGRFNKTLHPEQMELLSKSEGSKNALWLSLACEEIRVFGTFERVTQYVRNLPSTLDGLLEQILCRLVKEDESNYVQKALCFLESARGGLREDSLPLLMSDHPVEEKEAIPMLHWAMVQRTLRPFLKVATSYQQLSVFKFFHQSIGKAARKQWLLEEKDQIKYHARLADLFMMQCPEQRRLVPEAAYHMNAAKQVDRLIKFIKNDPNARFLNKVEIARYLKMNKCGLMVNAKFDKSVTQLFICQFCGPQRGAFSKNSMWPNKDTCALCGELVNQMQRKPGHEAYWCGRHPRQGPFFGNMPTCHVCKRPIQLGAPTPLYLCHWCHPSAGFPTCCRLKNE